MDRSRRASHASLGGNDEDRARKRRRQSVSGTRGDGGGGGVATVAGSVVMVLQRVENRKRGKKRGKREDVRVGRSDGKLQPAPDHTPASSSTTILDPAHPATARNLQLTASAYLFLERLAIRPGRRARGL